MLLSFELSNYEVADDGKLTLANTNTSSLFIRG